MRQILYEKERKYVTKNIFIGKLLTISYWGEYIVPTTSLILGRVNARTGRFLLNLIGLWLVLLILNAIMEIIFSKIRRVVEEGLKGFIGDVQSKWCYLK